MARYPVLPDGGADIRDLKIRMKSLEARIANLGSQPAGTPPAAVYDANVIYNGGMESGITGWPVLYFTGTAGLVNTESVNPLDQLFSLRVNEAAASFSRVFWQPAGSLANIVVGADVFPTVPGEQWLLSCLISSTVDVPDATLAAAAGAAPADVYGTGGSTTWLTAATAPLSAGSPTTLSGLVTVPTGYNYIGLHVAANPSASTAAAWSWTLDVVSMQRKL